MQIAIGFYYALLYQEANTVNIDLVISFIIVSTKC